MARQGIPKFYIETSVFPVQRHALDIPIYLYVKHVTKVTIIMTKIT